MMELAAQEVVLQILFLGNLYFKWILCFGGKIHIMDEFANCKSTSRLLPINIYKFHKAEFHTLQLRKDYLFEYVVSYFFLILIKKKYKSIYY